MNSAIFEMPSDYHLVQSLSGYFFLTSGTCLMSIKSGDCKVQRSRHPGKNPRCWYVASSPDSFPRHEQATTQVPHMKHVIICSEFDLEWGLSNWLFLPGTEWYSTVLWAGEGNRASNRWWSKPCNFIKYGI